VLFVFISVKVENMFDNFSVKNMDIRNGSVHVLIHPLVVFLVVVWTLLSATGITKESNVIILVAMGNIALI